MDVAGHAPLRRFEPGWLLAGLGWGATAGFYGALVRLGVHVVTSDGAGLDAPLLLVITAVIFAVSFAIYGGVIGLLTGLVVMLAVGRDPVVRADRRAAATAALIVAPLAVLTFLWWSFD